MKGIVSFSKQGFFREVFSNYASEWLFFLFLTLCVAVSHLLSFSMSVQEYESVFTPTLNSGMCVYCFIASLYTFYHSMGMRVRRTWAWILMLVCLGEVLYLVLTFGFHFPFIDITADSVTWHELIVSAFLIWVFLLYPSEALRPGWMNVKHACLQLAPIFFWELLNAILPYNISILLPLYLVVLIVVTALNMRPYRLWCEDNFSTMDSIDVSWFIRYFTILFLLTASYVYICLSHNPMRSFTQQWMVFFLLVYSTSHILRHRDPWTALTVQNPGHDAPCFSNSSLDASLSEEKIKTCRQKLEQWMEHDKPYVNPDFCLDDVQAVLPLDRAFIIRFFHTEYGCTFYRFVNDYRRRDALRLLHEHPGLAEADVARLAGLSLEEWNHTSFKTD